MLAILSILLSHSPSCAAASLALLRQARGCAMCEEPSDRRGGSARLVRARGEGMGGVAAHSRGPCSFLALLTLAVIIRPAPSCCSGVLSSTRHSSSTMPSAIFSVTCGQQGRGCGIARHARRRWVVRLNAL